MMKPSHRITVIIMHVCGDAQVPGTTGICNFSRRPVAPRADALPFACASYTLTLTDSVEEGMAGLQAVQEGKDFDFPQEEEHILSFWSSIDAFK